MVKIKREGIVGDYRLVEKHSDKDKYIKKWIKSILTSLNSKIATILQNEGLSLEYQAIGKWLSRVNDVQSPLSNPISTIKS